MRNGNATMPRQIQQPQNNMNLQPIKNLMSQFKLAQNQQAMIQGLINQSPEIAQIFQLAKGNNVSLQQVAQVMAQQRGINLDQLVQELQS